MFTRVVSDLHLELSKNWRHTVSSLLSTAIPNNTTLLLPGDVGNPRDSNYKEFINEMSMLYENVILTTGNHEYYQHDKSFTMNRINGIVEDITNVHDNVHYLNRKSIVINRVRFLGCTLWSKTDKELKDYMNDFKMIPEFTPNICEHLHMNDTRWLSDELDKTSSQFDKTVVLTHHLPTKLLLATKYKNHPLNIFFASDIDYLVKKANLWVCGHSHYASYAQVGGCHCYLNPLGYHHENSNYNPEMLIDIS